MQPPCGGVMGVMARRAVIHSRASAAVLNKHIDASGSLQVGQVGLKLLLGGKLALRKTGAGSQFQNLPEGLNCQPQG